MGEEKLDVSNEFTWIDCKERLPINEGDILILVGGIVFVCMMVDRYTACIVTHGNYFYRSDKTCGFNIETGVLQSKSCFVDWVIPDYMKRPTHWCKIPKLPEVKE